MKIQNGKIILCDADINYFDDIVQSIDNRIKYGKRANKNVQCLENLVADLLVQYKKRIDENELNCEVEIDDDDIQELDIEVPETYNDDIFKDFGLEVK